MADGKIVIDIDLDPNQVRADARVIEQILRGIGNNAGNGMTNNFQHNAQQLSHQAQQAAHNIQQQFSHPVNLNINLNSQNATHNATNAFNQINHQAQQTQGHLSHLKEIFEGTFLANAAESGIEAVKEGVKSLIETGIEYNAEQDKMVAVWGVLTGSATKGHQMVDMVNNFQRATGYATETLNEMEQKIYHIKGSASETQTMTKAFTTLGDAMGLSEDRLKGVTEQFAQMMSNGKAYAGDLNIMTNAFPAFGDALQEHMHMGMGQIRKMASQGKLSATEVEDTLIDMQKKYASATEAVMGTTQGLWRTMQSNYGRLAGSFAKPLFDMKKSGFKDLSDWLSSNQAADFFQGLGKKVADAVGYLVDFVSFLKEHKGALLEFAKAIGIVVGSILAIKAIKGVSSAITSVIEGIGALVKALGSAEAMLELLGGPVGWIVLAITLLGIGFVEAYKKSKPFHDFINGLGKDIKQGWEWITKFGEAIKDLFSGDIGGITKGTSIMEKLGLSSKQQVEISKVVGTIKSTISGIGSAVGGAVKWIGQFGTAVKDMFGGISSISKGTSIMKKLGLDPEQQKLVSQAVGAIKKAFQSFKDTVKEVWGYIEPTLVKGMKTVWTSIQSGLDTVKKYWNKIFPELQPALDGLVKVLNWVLHTVFLPMMIDIKIALGALSNSWKAIWGAICKVIAAAWDTITGAVKVGWDIVSGVFEVILDLLSGKFSKAWKDMKSTVVTTLTDLWKSIKKIAGDIGGAFVDLGKGIADGLLGGLAAGVNAAVDGINWILDKVHSKTQLKHWKAPKYANGTDGHPGGLAVVGDGKKRELIKYPTGETFLSPATDTLVNLPRGTSVLNGNSTEMLMSVGAVPRYANGIGSAMNWVRDKASSAVDSLAQMGKNVWNLATDPMKFVSGVVSKFSKFTSMLEPGLSLAKGAASVPLQSAADWLKSFLHVGSNGPTGKVSGNITQWIMEAMGFTNTPAQYLGGLTEIAMHESGGNPHAINLWDSNAKAGHPSKGLMQTIDSTFNRYAMHGLGDIWNPVANAVAAIRYMYSRYGSISNVPGVRNLASGHGYIGYANGTESSLSGSVVVAENEPELIQTKDGRAVVATKATSFDDFMAGSKVTPLRKVPHYAQGIIAKAKSVINSIGNPSLTTPLVVAAQTGGTKTVVQIDMKPITVNSVLDGKIIAQTVTDVQNQNNIKNSRLRGEI